jgi:phosphoribosylanthranilate isomerase
MLLKVCGLRESENIKQLNQLEIDLLGFIFYPPSPRYAADCLDADLLAQIAKPKIGVFVNESNEKMLTLMGKFHFNYLQLHGNEEASQLKELQEKGIKLIKAFQINEAFDFTQLSKYQTYCDYFVFDSANKNYGGSGEQFNWLQLKNYTLTIPFLLSGGLSADDILSIKKFQHPQLAGIDINSRFEIEPGLKNTELIAHFIHQLKKN